MKKIGFDNNKYIRMQSEEIKKRIGQFGGKLYMEFGGKLFDDYHASRVLPGFEPDSKIRMLTELKDDVEIIVVINTHDIEKNKVRGDLGITYDVDVLRLIDAFREYGLFVGSVVLTRFDGSEAVVAYQKKLESFGLKVFRHYSISGYPSNLPLIISDDGYGKNDYIKTKRPLVVVTAPGPGSGKMAVCLSQLYHENKLCVKAGYAKFETFPIWNLALQHPVNMAYEAATADLNDVNMIDPYHLEAYGISTVNYNRDVAVFPVLNEMFNQIYGKSPYKSPTDMGVNMAGNCITDDEIVSIAAKEEIIRRYYKECCCLREGKSSVEAVEKINILMNKAQISTSDRLVVQAANKKEEITGFPAAAIELNDGTIITGKTSSLMGAGSAMVLNALKYLAGIDDEIKLISPTIIKPIQRLKVKYLGKQNPNLNVDETLIALTICAASDKYAKKALEKLDDLKDCQMHSTIILSQADENTFRKLKIEVTCEPKYQTDKLYHS